MDHLAEQSVLDLAAGALAGAAAAAIHAHLDSCAECRAVVAGVLRGDDTPPVLGAGSPDPAQATYAELPRPADARRSALALEIDRIDEYRVVELLGSGGMGTVYRAHDTLLDREVAIKVIARTSSPAARQRFLLEARAVARIRHQNVVVVHRVVAADQPYIVYDLVRGHTFGHLATPTPWPKVLQLAAGVLRGLAAAHACSVLHRDLKPANLMIDDHGDVVLVDFGLAKLDGDAGESSSDAADPGAPELLVTGTGVALGTPRYMAPEAWLGAPATPQTDLYSLGVVLYELLTGKLPFGDTELGELARRVCEDDPPPVASRAPWVPPMFAALIDQCLARDPSRRPAAAGALGQQLEALQLGRAFDVFERDRVQRVPPGNPYPGARPFGFEHQGVFFGRRDELRVLVEQLRSRPLVVIAGEAGAGKSSLCMAGLLPIVLRGALGGARKWVPVPLVPGARPLAALAAALADHVELGAAEVERELAGDPAAVVAKFRAGHRGGCTAHVLFVDQLEQLATLAERDEARRFAAILAAIAEPGPSVRVLATLRMADLIAVAQLPALASVIGQAIYLLLEPRDEAALREIIVEPARLGGVAIDEPIVTSLVAASASGELRIGELETRLAALWDGQRERYFSNTATALAQSTVTR